MDIEESLLEHGIEYNSRGQVRRSGSSDNDSNSVLDSEECLLGAGRVGARNEAYEANGEDDILLGLEQPLSWAAEENLDAFLSRLYAYWEGKGFTVIVIGQVLNVVALGFTGATSGILLLGFDYTGLHDPCLREERCSIWDACFRQQQFDLFRPFSMWKFLSILYLTAFFCYWCFAISHLLKEIKELGAIHEFVTKEIGCSERNLKAATWPEVASRIVRSQDHVRLCISRDLSEQDIVMRIMRKDNYLIGMLNKGVLTLSFSNLPGFARASMMTKTIEWNIKWCLLDAMFDDTFRIKEAFLCSPASIRQRFRVAAVVNIILSPFLLVFLLIYFFMKNAESLYHQPGSIGARQWSPLALWQLREFNELPCFVFNRLNTGHKAADKYISLFPNYGVSHMARFVAFVAGSFAAILIGLTIFEEGLLEKDLIAGKQTVWWIALLGVILAVSRSLIVDKSAGIIDPELALLEVAAHTHYYPRHWRGRAHTLEVQGEVEVLFRYRAALFFEELLSVILTPIILWKVLPSCSEEIVEFLQNHTVYIDGIGDVCSLSTFDIARHGNRKYASSMTAPKPLRSRNGKMEKSILSFAANYPTWEPPKQNQEVIRNVESIFEARTGPASEGYLNSELKHPNDNIWEFLLTYYPEIAKMFYKIRGEWPKSDLGASVPGLGRDNEAENPQGHQSAIHSLHRTSGIDKLSPRERVMVLQALLMYFYENQEQLHASIESHYPTRIPSATNQDDIGRTLTGYSSFEIG